MSAQNSRSRSQVLLVASAGLAFLLGGCQEQTPTCPLCTGRLQLILTWETGAAESKPTEAVRDPTVERIDLIIHRADGGQEMILARDSTRVNPGDTQSSKAVEVPAGDSTSAEVAAFGSIEDDIEVPLAGYAHFGRATGIVVSEIPETVSIVLRRFYPRSLQASGSVAGGYRLDWAPVPGASRYMIRRFLPDGSPADTVVDQNSVTFPPAAEQQQINRLLHRIRAENAYFQGAFSDTIGVAFQGPMPPPNRPTLLTVTPELPVGLRLNWQDNSDDEDGFVIERGDLYIRGLVPIDSVGANITTYLDVGPFTPGGTYHYQVRAYNANGSSPPGESPRTDVPPEAPGDITATAIGTDQIQIDWTRPRGLADSLWVERQNATGGFGRVAQLEIAVDSWIDTHLTARTDYVYRLRARRLGQSSTPSGIVGARTLPEPPAELQITTVSTDSIGIAWSYGSNPDGFRLERRPSGEPNWALLSLLAGERRRAGDGGLQPRTIYAYRIAALDAGRLSSYAGPDSSRTLPEPPTSLEAEALANDTIQVSWTYSHAVPDSFRVERRRSGEIIWTALPLLSGLLQQFLDVGLQPRTLYAYRVAAQDAGQLSSYADPDSARTYPEIPGDLRAIETEERTVLLTWSYATLEQGSFTIRKRNVTAQGVWETLAVVGASLRQQEDFDVLPLYTYEYAIQAFDGDHLSKWTDPVSITLIGPPPNAPSDLSAAGSASDAISLSWTDNSDNETSFVIERKNPGSPTFTPIAQVRADTVTYTDVGLLPETTYVYRVKARNSAGDSASSNEATGETLPP